MTEQASVVAEPGNPVVKMMFDGGSKGNPGKAYGSYMYWGLIENREPVRIEFPGQKTNNQAEYMTLIEAVKAIITELDRLGLESNSTEIQIRSDSELLVKQLNGQFKVKSKKLRPLHQEATSLLSAFRQQSVQWHPRAESVRWLGH